MGLLRVQEFRRGQGSQVTAAIVEGMPRIGAAAASEWTSQFDAPPGRPRVDAG